MMIYYDIMLQYFRIYSDLAIYPAPLAASSASVKELSHASPRSGRAMDEFGCTAYRVPKTPTCCFFGGSVNSCAPLCTYRAERLLQERRGAQLDYEVVPHLSKNSLYRLCYGYHVNRSRVLQVQSHQALKSSGILLWAPFPSTSIASAGSSTPKLKHPSLTSALPTPVKHGPESPTVLGPAFIATAKILHILVAMADGQTVSRCVVAGRYLPC